MTTMPEVIEEIDEEGVAARFDEIRKGTAKPADPAAIQRAEMLLRAQQEREAVRAERTGVRPPTPRVISDVEALEQIRDHQTLPLTWVQVAGRFERITGRTRGPQSLRVQAQKEGIAIRTTSGGNAPAKPPAPAQVAVPLVDLTPPRAQVPVPVKDITPPRNRKAAPLASIPIRTPEPMPTPPPAEAPAEPESGPSAAQPADASLRDAIIRTLPTHGHLGWKGIAAEVSKIVGREVSRKTVRGLSPGVALLLGTSPGIVPRRPADVLGDVLKLERDDAMRVVDATIAWFGDEE